MCDVLTNKGMLMADGCCGARASSGVYEPGLHPRLEVGALADGPSLVGIRGAEEAHRYVPNKGKAQYKAAQEAIRRLAKEGRKYGIGLMLVSQRPSEVEATVLSQCNSWIVLRVTNDADTVRELISCCENGAV